jgi:hypothetical protein
MIPFCIAFLFMLKIFFYGIVSGAIMTEAINLLYKKR